jgi:hypothetical protein
MRAGASRQEIFDFLKCRVVIFFVFILVEVGLLTALTAIQFRAELGTILTRSLWNSGLTSADSGLQLDPENRAKRCLSEDPARAAYSAVPKIVETFG